MSDSNTVGGGSSEEVNPQSETRLTQEDLRQKLGDVLRMHQELQQAIAYAMSGKQQYEKKAQMMAEEAFLAALQPIIVEHYDGLINVAVDETGRSTFVGSED